MDMDMDMKLIVAAVLATLVTPAIAQTAPAAASTVSAGPSVETTPIATLAAEAKTKAVLEKELPQLLSHPAYEQFKTMTLRQLAPMSQGSITDDKLAAIQAEFAKIS